MRTVIRKWGNSPAVRLPVAVIAAADFKVEQAVVLKASRGRIVIEPSDHVEYNLEDLVGAITENNRHAEVDTGPPVGREAL